MITPVHLLDPVPAGRPVLLLAPGASAHAESPGVRRAAAAIADAGVAVVRCELDYQRARRETGRRGRQPSAEQVVDEYAVATAGLEGPVIVGGLSFGGRVATMAAERGGALGAVALGYPFHPPSAPEKVRTAHLLATSVPVLVCQGTRDEFGTRDQVAGYGLPDAVHVHWLEGADHGLRPQARSGRSGRDVLDEVGVVVAAWVEALTA